MKAVIYKDGSYKMVDVSWEYENDPDWLCTIDQSEFKSTSTSAEDIAEWALKHSPQTKEQTKEELRKEFDEWYHSGGFNKDMFWTENIFEWFYNKIVNTRI